MQLPEATEADKPIYEFTEGCLPAGVTYNSERRISGTPTAAKAKNTCTYTATDEESEEKTDLEFDVEAVVAPSFATDATIDDQFWLSGTEIDTLTLPEATGGTGTLTYSLTPAAPAGLEFDATDRTITGTPTAAATTEFTYTVTDGNGTKTPLTFEITVGTALLFGSNTIAAQTWTQDEAITDLTLPEATGGVGTLTYSLSPTLPAGVTFAAGTRTGQRRSSDMSDSQSPSHVLALVPKFDPGAPVRREAGNFLAPGLRVVQPSLRSV